MKYFFITTDHLEKRIWFRDDEDFKVGMNYVAVTVCVKGVIIVAFILMSNHVHFLVAARNKAEALRAIEYFKKLYGTHYHRKYGENRFFRRNGVDIQEITDENEAIEKVIAYIIMNSVAARICASVSGYKWGSGACYFNENKEIGTPVSDFSGRKLIALVKSRAKLPGNWTIGAGGYVLPESYIPVKGVENQFKNPARFNYFLNSSSKAKKARELNIPAFRDQVIAESINDLCVTVFNKKGVWALNATEKEELVRQISWRFGADAHQIGRITGISYSEVTEMLNRL
jgi:REP element-mobilizing transposase RayT